jgi:hypothetical protein
MRTENRPELSPDAERFKNVAKANVRTYLGHIAKHCPDNVVRAVIAGGLHSMAAFAVQRYGGRKAYELLQGVADAVASDTELLSPTENRHV